MTADRPKQTWLEVVSDALKELGGEAHLSEISSLLESHPKTATNPTWRNTIRRVVRQYSAFEPVPPARSGRYRLVEKEEARLSEQQLPATNSITDHSAAQGMLVALGNTYGYETFVPKSDQTSRRFQESPLSELVSVRDVSTVFSSSNLRQVALIDVLWLEEDEDGLFPVAAFEVEHSTRITDGLNRLLKIPKRYSTQLFVVGPTQEEARLFEQRVGQAPFRDHRDRFAFRPYAQLEQLFNAAIRHRALQAGFGVVERWKRYGAVWDGLR